MIFTIEEVAKRIKPIAQEYQLNAVYLFGSYARNEATEKSDVDLLIDRANSKIKGMFDMGGLYNDLCSILEKEVDLVTLQSLEQKSTKTRTPWFVDNVIRERVKIYEPKR